MTKNCMDALLSIYHGLGKSGNFSDRVVGQLAGLIVTSHVLGRSDELLGALMEAGAAWSATVTVEEMRAAKERKGLQS